MSKLIDFNINEYVHVQLTNAGREELRRQHEELRKTFPGLGEHTPVKEDKDGWAKFQGWVLMSTFGHMISRTSKPPFLSNVKISKGE